MTNTLIRLCAGVALIAALPGAAGAHRQWMLPSSTSLSGADSWVTVDAAVSNDLFYFEHQPMRLTSVKAWAPDGTEAPLENAATGRYRSTFDVHLTKPGTYRIASDNQGLIGSYRLNGEEKRLPRGTSAADLATAIPAGATDVKLSENLNRNEIYVTLGEPTPVKPTGRGLELVPVTHPNDLVAGEAARFRFQIDGRAAAGLKVAVVPGGIRYRQQLNEMALTADANGEVTLTAPEPGFYWINATAEDDKGTLPNVKARRLGYVTTVEVMAP